MNLHHECSKDGSGVPGHVGGAVKHGAEVLAFVEEHGTERDRPEDAHDEVEQEANEVDEGGFVDVLGGRTMLEEVDGQNARGEK